jgi:hypothetical protein
MNRVWRSATSGSSWTLGAVSRRGQPGAARRRRLRYMDRVAIFERLRKLMTLPEMAVLLRVPVRSLTRRDAAALDRAAKKLLGLHPARSRGSSGKQRPVASVTRTRHPRRNTAARERTRPPPEGESVAPSGEPFR